MQTDRFGDRMRNAIRLVFFGLSLLTVFALSSTTVGAQSVTLSVLQGQIERASQNVTALGADLMGDQVNLYNGALEFAQTDVSLPGNNTLPVAIGRRHTAGRHRSIEGQLGDWDLDVPHLHGVFAASLGWVNGAGNTSRCSTFTAPPHVLGYQLNYWYAPEYWQGNFLRVPDAGEQEVLKRSAGNTLAPTDGYGYPLVTRDHWQLRCVNLVNGAGEGFLALSPDGVQYRFDWMASRTHAMLRGANNALLGRREYWLLPTLVTDRYGNTVTYSYDAANPLHLTQIAASDGRTITLTYATISGKPRLQSVYDGTRTWIYGYDAQAVLSQVTLPDGSSWQFNLGGLVYPTPSDLGEDATCNFQGGWPDSTLSGTITHPSGAVGTFQTKYIKHARSNVTKYCINKTGTPGGPDYARWPRALIAQTLVSKSISGPGLTPLTWTYDYPSGSGFWTCTTCPNSKVVHITDARGFLTRYTYGIRYQNNEGQLLRVEQGWNGSTALRTTNYRYRLPSGMPYPEPAGVSPSETTDYLAARHRPRDQASIDQQGVTFTWQASAFDAFARVTGANAFNTLGYSRSDSRAYYDHSGKWVLGQLASRTDGSTGLTIEANAYDATTANRTASYRFGQLLNTYAYFPDGTLATLFDPLGRGTSFSNYLRGLPRDIIYYDGTGESATVNNLGNITSYTNAAGTTHSFGYDSMGRLASLTPPGGDAVNYYATARTFEKVASAEYGLPAGHWRLTVSTGNARDITYFDALWRPRLTRTFDTADESSTRRMVQSRYDADNRKMFDSYPARSISSIDASVPGIAQTYDALGRVFVQYTDSELGLLSSTTEYLAGFQRRVTNPRGYATTYSFQAFDTPSDEAVTAISAPEGLSIGVSRDVFGKPLDVTRSGNYGGASLSATRSYVYDGYQRLCKTIEPETGATVQAYDSAGFVAWSASGLALPGTTSCDQASVPAARKASFTYDSLGRPTGTSFGDGSAAISRSYTPDGLPWQISAAGSTWTLSYNNRRLLTQESLGYAGSTYAFGWGVDAYGQVSSLGYPDGASVSYAPNALGEPSQVSGYASAISYHPNGAIAGYTLANGIAHTLTQNSRGLPLLWRDAGVVQDQYGFDADGNVTSIADQQEGLSSRTLGYDGLERLTSASGVWGAGSFGYDVLDNLRTSTVGTRTTVATLDAGNRVSSLAVNGTPTAISYDSNGNVSQRGAQAFGFDLANRLASATGIASYTYDGLGRRLQIAYASGVQRRQLYSQAGQLLYATDSAAGTTRFVYLGRRLIAEVGSLSGTRFAHTDALASPVAYTNGAGALLGRTRYEPYGATAAGTNPTGVGYAGHVNDPDTALVYMQQRYYDPLLGRFLSVDPVSADGNGAGSFNRYWYANNNPYRFIDPDGREVCTGSRIDSGGSCDGQPGLQVSRYGSSEGSSTNAPSSAGSPSSISVCNAEECAEVRETRAGIAREGRERLQDAASYGGKEGALLVGGGLLGKLLSPVLRFLGFGGAEAARALTIGPKVAKQLGERGWTTAAVAEAKATGQQIKAINKANGNAATRYVHPQSGQSVVIDDVTGEVIHVGGPGFKYGPGSGDLP